MDEVPLPGGWSIELPRLEAGTDIVNCASMSRYPPGEGIEPRVLLGRQRTITARADVE